MTIVRRWRGHWRAPAYVVAGALVAAATWQPVATDPGHVVVALAVAFAAGSLAAVEIALLRARLAAERAARTGDQAEADADRRRAEENERHADRIRRIAAATTDLMATIDRSGRVLWANEAARAFSKLSDECNVHAPDFVAPDSLARFTDEIVPAVDRLGVWSGELTLRDADGQEWPVSLVMLAHYGTDGRVDYYSGIARDLSERKALERQVVHDTRHDRLTGLPNRVVFLDRVQQALVRSERHATYVAVLAVDIDRFKVVNDSLGHQAGDALLVAVAGRLAALLEPGGSAARFGSDEFTVLCDEVSCQDDAVAIAESIHDALAEPFVIDGERLHVTASIGVAIGHRAGRAEDLLRGADSAVHRAKARGRSKTEVFDEQLRATAVRRVELETALHLAVDRGELRVFYQPEVCLPEGRLVGAEALVRWLHPTKGVISPAEFIPLAEEAGLIADVGEWVLREACWQAARWRYSRTDGKPLVVWVNVSPRQLRGDIVSVVASAIGEAGITASQLGLEITESALMDDPKAVVTLLEELKALGVRLALDDFGTGYSSLSYLRRLPIDAVKVDRSFVSGLGRNARDDAIAEAIVGMAGALNITPFAEGVETVEQARHLRRLGFKVAQGFYFSRPGPRHVVDSLLVRRVSWPLDEPAAAAPSYPLDVPGQRLAAEVEVSPPAVAG